MEFIGHGINISDDSLLCQPCDEQGGNNSALQCFEDTIELSTAVPIGILTTNFILTPNLSIVIEPGQLFAIDEPGNPNNGIYQVEDAVPNSEIFTNITFMPGVPDQIFRTASMLFPKTVAIEHNLNSSNIIYQLSSVEQNNIIKVDSDSSNPNQLIIKPLLPLKGSFRILILTKPDSNNANQP